MNIKVFIVVTLATLSHAYRDNSKFIGNNFDDDYDYERRLGNKRRPGYGNNPCQFGSNRPKQYGRTFFDLQYLNVEQNYNLQINCGGYPASQYPQKPEPVPHQPPVHEGHRPLGHKPIGHRPLGHRPMGGLLQNWFGNRPQGGLFSQSSSSSSSAASETPGISGPQQFATGLSQGIQSFIGTIPAIGQSFQSILPSWSDFSLPQLNFGGPVTFPPLQGFNQVNQMATVPPVVTSTIDPDDIIYSDQIKPVSEDYDPISDPYIKRYLLTRVISGQLPPGQYLTISNPHLGSYTQNLDVFRPGNLFNTWQQVVDELSGYF